MPTVTFNVSQSILSNITKGETTGTDNTMVDRLLYRKRTENSLSPEVRTQIYYDLIKIMIKMYLVFQVNFPLVE